jgi:adenylate kinase
MVTMRNFVFIGSPGSGKGTHADLMSSRLGILHISTGDLYRDEMEQGTPLGLEAKKLLDQGKLGTDEMTETLLRRRLKQADAQAGFILDGFPRTLAQTEILNKLLQERGQHLDAAIFLQISDRTVLDRLSGRLICSACQKSYHVEYNPPKQVGVCDVCGAKLERRKDDEPETIKKRLKVFHAQTEPILEYYRQKQLLVTIDANAEVEEVSARIKKAVEQFLSR